MFHLAKALLGFGKGTLIVYAVLGSCTEKDNFYTQSYLLIYLLPYLSAFIKTFCITTVLAILWPVEIIPVFLFTDNKIICTLRINV